MLFNTQVTKAQESLRRLISWLNSQLVMPEACQAILPNLFEQTVRSYGEYSPRSRGKRRAVEAKAGKESTPLPASFEPLKTSAVSRSWARLIKKFTR